MDRRTYIYELVDPRSGDVCYIGKTVRPRGRLVDHMCFRFRTDSPVNMWLRDLSDAGAKPEMVIVDDDSDGTNWKQLEKDWIAFGFAVGYPLTNISAGGQGTTGHCHTAGAKAAMSHKLTGRKFSDETRAKMSASGKAKVFTDEHRANIAAGRRGLKFTTEHSANISKALMGHKISDETREKMKAGQRKRQVRERAEREAKVMMG